MDSAEDAEFLRAMSETQQPRSAQTPQPVQPATQPASNEDDDFVRAMSSSPSATKASSSASVPVDSGSAVAYGIANAMPFSHDIGAGIQALEQKYLPQGYRPDNTGPEVDPNTPFAARMAAQKARIDATDKAVSEQHPYLSTAATLGASVGALPFAGPAEGLSSGISYMAPRLGGLAADAAGAGLVGGVYGGLYGAGTGNSLDERLGNAERGAVIGGAGGALAEPLAAGVSKSLSALMPANTRATQTISNAFAKDENIPGPRMSAADMAAARTNGQPAVLADMGPQNGNVKSLARSVANLSPSGDATLSNAVHERFEDQGPRLADFLQKTFGSNLDAGAAREALKAQSRPVIGPAYKQAMADGANGVWSPQLANFLQSPAVQAAARGATAKSANEAAINGVQAVKSPFIDMADGSVGLRQNPDGSVAVPNLQFWDYVKRGLGDQIGAAQRGGQDDTVRQLTGLKNNLVSQLDQAVPSYAAARKTAFDAFGADNALEAGENFLKMAGTAKTSEMKSALAQMNPQQKQIFSQGLASEMAQKALNAPDRRNVIAMFNSPEVSQRLQLGLGSRANDVEAFLRRESVMDMLRPTVTGGSTTAKQSAAQLGHSFMGALASGVTSPTAGAAFGAANAYHQSGFDPWEIGKQAGYGALAGLAGKGLGARHGAMMEAVARQLASGDPAVINAATNRIGSTPFLMQALRKTEQGLTKGAATAVSRQGAGNSQAQPGNVYVQPRAPQPQLVPAMARADGGSVKKPSHEYLVNRLMNMVEKAKKAEKERTKPLLKVPDDTVANALAAAQRAI